MTTELVILLTICVLVIAKIVGLPASSFDKSGPHLGMRLEKQIATAPGFEKLSFRGPNPISWQKKNE
jgi:hypothetical protein